MPDLSVVQTNIPCAKCGSWYRRGDVCNICGNKNIIKETTRERCVLGCHAVGVRGQNKKKYKY